jgi:TonB family protein
MQTMRILFTLATLAILGACASAGGGRASQMPEIETALPVSAFIDSAALHQALLAAPPVPATLTLQPLFTVVYDSTGALMEVEPMSDFVIPPVWGDSISKILRRHVLPRITTRKPVVENVWLVSGPSPRIAVVDDFVEVKPVLLNGLEVARSVETIATRLAESGMYARGREFRATLSVRVNEQGGAEAPSLLRSSGNLEVNREIVALAAKMRFQPAQLSGYPVAVLVSIPVTISIPPTETGTATTSRRRGPG